MKNVEEGRPMSGDNRVLIRPYEKDRDFKDILRIWEEVGWTECENTQAMEIFLGTGRTTVAEVNGHAESMTTTISGSLLHMNTTLDLSVVAAVVTGHVARKLKLARKLTAFRLAEEAERGAVVSALGMFEQGYYNTLGFGTGSYLHICTFQPSSLKHLPPHRIPVRLTPAHVKEIHQNRVRQRPCHGKILMPEDHTLMELLWKKNGFGLGFRDTSGELTHHMWLTGKGREQGPYRVEWMAYRTTQELLELLSVLRTLGDQIHSVQMIEPPHLQLQDILDKPFFYRSVSRDSLHKAEMKAQGVFQFRIINLSAALEKTHLQSAGFSFNLHLTDPVEAFLDPDTPWSGCGGNYLVSLGENCKAVPGISDPSLPVLTCSVNAFSRMWLGVRPASVLQASEHIEGSPKLIDNLDVAFNLPTPHFNWEF